ncbi:Carboxylic ester hydrolase [Indibacter alkaliphilus LW1]|uniref:Carboxylic ester hydrolase n=1 Tax=Indibacter alkaliphilus (strain CCUG 57479 / KCTC 22604 / LW1) TaxID=1189612 RepID=S2DJH5_INDAL|nr:hypothetical protein [Indibacter alkaliphilus]EOZ99234.1 Carboxylic ester hydrolase [Indibacter alkaliphilus LW1]
MDFRVDTNTFVSPEIQNKKFPVLIFSHGLYSEAFGYYALMEEIVSHGFIVLNINHTYESSGSLFPDGEILLFHSEFDEKNNNSTMAEMAWVASQNYWNASTLDTRYSAVEDLIRNYVGAEITERWSKDIKAVLN